MYRCSPVAERELRPGSAAAARARPSTASISSSSSSDSFMPSPAKNLMPLSEAGLWEAEITTPELAPRSIVRKAIAGRRLHAGHHRVAPACADPLDERVLEPLAGLPRVTADHESGPALAVASEHDDGRRAEPPREVRGQLGAGLAAHAIGAEQPSHRRVRLPESSLTAAARGPRAAADHHPLSSSRAGSTRCRSTAADSRASPWRSSSLGVRGMYRWASIPCQTHRCLSI